MGNAAEKEGTENEGGIEKGMENEGIEKYVCTWEIEDWKSKLQSQNSLRSRDFKTKNGLSFYTLISKVNTSESSRVCFYSFCVYLSGNNRDIFVKTGLFGLDCNVLSDFPNSKVWKLSIAENEKALSKEIGICNEETGGNSLSGNAVTLCCEITIATGKETVSHLEGSSKLEVFDDLHFVLENRKFTDFTIIAENRSFPVHRVILTARSPVFAAKLSQETGENTEQHLNIDDFDSVTVQNMLQFMYSGKMPNLNCSYERLEKLLKISDKFEMRHLKARCVERLIFDLNIQNATKIILGAYENETQKLQDFCVTFFAKNSSKIIKTSNWEEYSRQLPKFVNVLLQSVSQELAQDFQECVFSCKE